MKVALVCIAKDEDPYIEEWVNYHIKLGFDNIFIYQNDYRHSYDNPKITKIDFDGGGRDRQTFAYNKFIRDYSHEYDFAAFFDVDEFLVLKKHKDIKDFLEDYSDFSAIGINWVLFGDNGLQKVENNEYSCIKRFTKRQVGVYTLVKCIVKLDKPIVMSSHHPYCEWVCPNKILHNGAQNHNGDDTIAQLNHYFCKTYEEFQYKVRKGRVCNNPLPEHFFMAHNFNDVEDLHAYNFFYI